MADIKYKTGLCYYALMKHDQASADFETAADYIQKEIDARKAGEQTAETAKAIEEFVEVHGEIKQKIADVQETKAMVRATLTFVRVAIHLPRISRIHQRSF